VLLFEVGLESTLREMLRVGLRSLSVALLGVVAPWVLGFLAGRLLLPDHGVLVHVFLGAILTATSVGITARVLRDLGQAQSLEARIILGAAVIDDVIGLVILAVLGSMISAADRGTTLSLGAATVVLAKALAFLLGAFSIGAYAAGLILEDAHVIDFADRGEHRLEELVRPISMFLAPVFFVLMGMRVELGALLEPGVLALAALLTAAAIVGKQMCSIGAIGAPVDGTTIGIGMMPRGEVGFIFANFGLALTVRGERIVDERVFAAVVFAVMMTTLITPPALKWRFSRASRRREAASAAPDVPE